MKTTVGWNRWFSCKRYQVLFNKNFRIKKDFLVRIQIICSLIINFYPPSFDHDSTLLNILFLFFLLRIFYTYIMNLNPSLNFANASLFTFALNYAGLRISLSSSLIFSKSSYFSNHPYVYWVLYENLNFLCKQIQKNVRFHSVTTRWSYAKFLIKLLSSLPLKKDFVTFAYRFLWRWLI